MKIITVILLVTITVSFVYGVVVNPITHNLNLVLDLPSKELDKISDVGDNVRVYFEIESVSEPLEFEVGCKTKDGIGPKCNAIIPYRDLMYIGVQLSFWERGLEYVYSVLTLPFLIIGTLLGIVSWA